MQLTDKNLLELNRGLASASGIGCEIGPFRMRLRANDGDFAKTLVHMYEGSPASLTPGEYFNDFEIRLRRPDNHRRYWRPQVSFETDTETPFEPFPLANSFPYFEWGLNWLIATRAHQYLLFHSAVLERHGRALILPALPGSGKSTLCAALMLRGWRLLSDEFGLFRPETGLLEPIPRPIPLKNVSIEVIRNYSSEAVLGPVYHNTQKGDVAHLRPTPASMDAVSAAVPPAWIVFPQYLAGAEELLHPFAKGRAFLKLSGNSFNYKLQGGRGFSAVADVIDSSESWYLEFSDLDKAAALLSAMTDDSAARDFDANQQAVP